MKQQLMNFGATLGIWMLFAITYYFAKRVSKKNENESGECRKASDDEETTAPELDDPNEWIEIGRINELYYYPLKSGKGKPIDNCRFTDYGISVEQDGFATLKDRMLLVYSGENGKFQTGRNYPRLLTVEISAVDDNSVKLEADGSASIVVIRLPEKEIGEGTPRVECSMWWGERVNCIDCGPEPAAWISKFLTGSTNSNLRIGSAISDRRNLHEGPWEKFTKVYKTMRNEDTGYFADLASYMLISQSSLDEVNKKLGSAIKALQFRPNIVVESREAFDEDFWEWIKIGKNVLLRNIKPCPRCSMIRINPENGVIDKPDLLKTLRSFRGQTIEERIKVDGTAPTIGIYCGLYKMGPVQVGDKVFVQRFSTKKID